MRGKLLENVISQLESDIVKSEMDGTYARMKTNEQEPTDSTDYEEEAADQTNIMPSIRDNEYIEHSSLWGAQYMSGTNERVLPPRLPWLIAAYIFFFFLLLSRSFAYPYVCRVRAGGAGEGAQTLNPENPARNTNEVKTDATLPAYCNPPNPCPVGYTGECI